MNITIKTFAMISGQKTGDNEWDLDLVDRGCSFTFNMDIPDDFINKEDVSDDGIDLILKTFREKIKEKFQCQFVKLKLLKMCKDESGTPINNDPYICGSCL